MLGAQRGASARSRKRLGSRSRSKASELVLRAPAQAGSQEGGPARRTLFVPLTRRAVGPSSKTDGSRGAVRLRVARRGVTPQTVPEEAPVPEQNGAHESSPNVTGKEWLVTLSGAERRRVREAETPLGSAEAGSEFDTTEGALSRSSIFSPRGDGSSKRGDGGTTLVSRSSGLRGQ